MVKNARFCKGRDRGAEGGVEGSQERAGAFRVVEPQKHQPARQKVIDF